MANRPLSNLYFYVTEIHGIESSGDAVVSRRANVLGTIGSAQIRREGIQNVLLFVERRKAAN